jgi:hypothetical protein
LGSHCFTNGPNSQRCPNLYFAPAEYEIAFSEQDGIVDKNSWVGFGGDMNISGQDINQLIDNWSNICRIKVQEALMDYKSATTDMERTDL